jgi:hypothetical protein
MSDEREDDQLAEREQIESNERAAKRAKREAKLAQDRLLNAYVSTMSTPAGRVVIWDILNKLGMFEHHLMPDVRLTDQSIGRQYTAAWLVAYLRAACPQHTKAMFSENL